METCYDLVAARVSPEEWEVFAEKLIYGFKSFPESWGITGALRDKMILKMQWEYFNPDIVEGIATRRSRSWAFVTSFLVEAFQRKFNFLRARLSPEQMEKWDRDFASFEGLLYLCSMEETMQLEWLSNFEARVRFGEARRARVIKNTGLGLSSEILGVHIMMNWEQIKAQYRFMLKKHHPDVGGDPVLARQMIEDYRRLVQAAGKKE